MPTVCSTVGHARHGEALGRIGKASSREGLLLGGSAAAPGYRGCHDHSLECLEPRAPGVTARFWAGTMKGWRRNAGPMQRTLRCQHVDDGGHRCDAPALSIAKREAWRERLKVRAVPQYCHAHLQTAAFEFLKNHEHTSGPWCWVLADVRRLREPLTFKGGLGLRVVPADVEQEIRRRLR